MMGIYKIVNIVNDKLYIGSSKHLEKRWDEHKYLLNKDKHHSKRLQNAWNRYGEQNFKFEIVQEVESDNLLFLFEQEWLDKTESYKSNKGYNICSIAGEPPIEVLKKKRNSKKSKLEKKDYYSNKIHDFRDDVVNQIANNKDVFLKIDIREKEFTTNVYNRQMALYSLLPIYYRCVMTNIYPSIKNQIVDKPIIRKLEVLSINLKDY